MYTCSKGCQKVFATRQCEKRHSEGCSGVRHVPVTVFPCTKGCGKVLKSAQGCNYHSFRCGGTKRRQESKVAAPCPCPRGCGKTFLNKYNASRHAQHCVTAKAPRQTERFAFKCKKCDRIFSRVDALKRHEQRCGVVFSCEKGCGAEFATEHKCSQHEAACTYKRRQFWCPTCVYKGYVHLQHYEQHSQRCTQRPPQSMPFTGSR